MVTHYTGYMKSDTKEYILYEYIICLKGAKLMYGVRSQDSGALGG